MMNDERFFVVVVASVIIGFRPNENNGNYVQTVADAVMRMCVNSVGSRSIGDN